MYFAKQHCIHNYAWLYFTFKSDRIIKKKTKRVACCMHVKTFIGRVAFSLSTLLISKKTRATSFTLIFESVILRLLYASIWRTNCVDACLQLRMKTMFYKHHFDNVCNNLNVHRFNWLQHSNRKSIKQNAASDCKTFRKATLN